jgi:putative flippase GtrA
MSRKFLKAQASSILATAVDFVVTRWLSWLAGLEWSFGANMLGSTAGGITNFLFNRQLVFGKENGTIGWQAFKYLIVWMGNLLLNASGVWLLIYYTAWPPMICKAIVAVLLAVGYNYGMQKRFVFKQIRQ